MICVAPNFIKTLPIPAPVAKSLTEEKCKKFHRRSRSKKTSVRLKERLSIVLLSNEELSNNEISERLPFSVYKISRWRNRFSESGLKGIEKDHPRGGNHGGADSANGLLNTQRTKTSVLKAQHTEQQEPSPPSSTPTICL